MSKCSKTAISASHYNSIVARKHLPCTFVIIMTLKLMISIIKMSNMIWNRESVAGSHPGDGLALQSLDAGWPRSPVLNLWHMYFLGVDKKTRERQGDCFRHIETNLRRTTRLSTWPWPSWPFLPSPQVKTRPSVVSATMWVPLTLECSHHVNQICMLSYSLPFAGFDIVVATDRIRINFRIS